MHVHLLCIEEFDGEKFETVVKEDSRFHKKLICVVYPICNTIEWEVHKDGKATYSKLNLTEAIKRYNDLI